MPRSFWRGIGLFVLVAASFLYGFVAHRNRIFPYSWFHLARRHWESRLSASKRGVAPGEWQQVSRAPVAPGPSEELRALPYLQGYAAASTEVGVTVYKRGRAYEGLNLYSSGHAPEAILMDMAGKRVHVWRHEFRKVWPDVKIEDENRTHPEFWTHIELLEGGNLLALFEGIGLIKLDAESRLQWSFLGGAHHDFHVNKDGTIFALTRRREHVARLGVDPVLVDFIVQLDGQGRPIKEVSILRCLERSKYAPFLRGIPVREDPFHTNAIEVLASIPPSLRDIARPGQALISIRNLDLIGLVDLEREEFVWALTGMWHGQHSSSFLPEGALLLFDNQGHPSGNRSRVLEIDPHTQVLRWQYPANDAQALFSKGQGWVERLPNGNTLITESAGGRSLEVDANHETLWEFRSPHRAGASQELVATLFRVFRITEPRLLAFLGPDMQTRSAAGENRLNK